MLRQHSIPFKLAPTASEIIKIILKSQRLIFFNIQFLKKLNNVVITKDLWHSKLARDVAAV